MNSLRLSPSQRFAPKKISVLKEKENELHRLFGWIETALSYKKQGRTFKDFKNEFPKGCKKIEEMKMTEDELLSIMAFCKIIADKLDAIHHP